MRGRVLDNFYVPARYPNGHPEGAPFEHYGPIQSGQAIEHAEAILAFVRTWPDRATVDRAVREWAAREAAERPGVQRIG